MRTSRIAPALVALVLGVLASGVAWADPDLSGRWTERWGVFSRRTVRFDLASTAARTWTAEVQSPRRGEPRRLTLTGDGDAWELRLERRVQATGLADVVAGERDDGWRWIACHTVPLTRTGDRLEGGGFVIHVPAHEATTPSTGPTSTPTSTPGGLGDASSSELPVVRVLLTGFDKFPRLVNHPHWYRGDELAPAEPRINPSGWAVRNFDAASIDPELRGRVRIQLHRLTDVPVVYVEGARTITSKIEEVDADVAISFGVGSDGNVDADVETTCTNLMHDGSGLSNEGEGPFQIPASWPPSGPSSSWSDEDRAWLWRYPDNAGVSYNRKPIDPSRPERLRSSLPVGQIVARCEREGLSAHDGRGGPGQYICNNVMFKVVDTQAGRGRIGGFIHLPQWDERKQQDYLKVLRIAVEEAVKAYLARPAN